MPQRATDAAEEDAPGAYTRLWAAVLYLAVNDIVRPASLKPSLWLSDHMARRAEAIRWVGKHPSRDFLQVCDMAGFDGPEMHSRLRHLSQVSLEDLAGLFGPSPGGRGTRTFTLPPEYFGRPAA